MGLDFKNDPANDCYCECGWYEQKVKGWIFKNKQPVLPSCLPNLNPNYYVEDRGGPNCHPFGYRTLPGANDDQYLNPDRRTGCTYKGEDVAGIAAEPGDTGEVYLEFEGGAVDACQAVYTPLGPRHHWVIRGEYPSVP
jgi:hypothetical protein